MNYIDLEKKHTLRDVVSQEEYGDKAHLMEVVLKDLLRHRGSIQGRDLMPGFDEARLWSTIVGSYSLLEQSLKLLVGIRTPDYLPPAKGKNTAISDGHDLGGVYSRLTELDRTILEENYAQYASFIEFPSKFPTLQGYLAAVGRGQVPWRYFLLEKGFAELSGLPSPLSPDMLLEATRAVVSILMTKGWCDQGNQNIIHRRLERSLGGVIARPVPLEAITADDLKDWVKEGRGMINAFSRYLRAGPLDNYSDAMKKWLDESVAVAKKMAGQDNDVDLTRFLNAASRCCLMFHDNRFSFRNHLPPPIASNALDIHGGWNIEWRTDTTMWDGPVDDVNELPLRAGQSFTATWHQAGNAPTSRDVMPGLQGQLVVRRYKRSLVSLNVHIFAVGAGSGWGSVDANRENVRINSATFIVLDSDDNVPEPVGLTCMICLGTGFCPECRGESIADSCGTCPTRNGLCPECLGYGRDGDHVIASAATSS